MQLLKNKFLIIVITLAAVVGVGGYLLAKQFVVDEDQSFAQNGYVLGDPVETEAGGYASPRIPFNAGTPYKTNYARELVFENAEKNKTILPDFGFAHYDDGSILALRNGVMLDATTISDNANIICFNVQAGSLIQKNGSAYSINHLGSDVVYNTIAWKVGDDHYIFAGSLVSLSLGAGLTEDLGSYVEVKYIDNGVMLIKSEEGVTFVTVSPDCKLTIDGRSIVNLAEGTIQNGNGLFAMNQMIIDNPDNFSLSPGIMEVNGVKLPEFVVEDGKDGESGDDGDVGEDGEAGPAGEAGAAGTEGTEGAEGASGASGAGGPGGAGSDDPGDDGSGETEIVSSLPNFTLPSLTIKEPTDFIVSVASGLRAKITTSDEDADNFVPATKVRAVIVNTETGKEVWGEDLSDIVGNGEINIDAPANLFEAGVKYMLSVTGTYTVNDKPDGSGSDHTYTKELFKRLFVGGAIGIDIVKAGTNAVTSTSIAVNILKDAYSEAATMTVEIYAPDGTKVGSQTVPQGAIQFSNDNPAVALVTFGGLDPNTTYSIKVVNLIAADNTTLVAADLGKVLVLKTLLASSTTKVHAPIYSTSRYESTVSLWPGLIEGISLNTITKYTYQVFLASEVDAAGGIGSAVPTLELVSTGRTPQIANVAWAGQGVDPITGQNYLQWNARYKARLIVEYFDNEKTIVKNGEFSTEFGISGARFPTVEFVPKQGTLDDPSKLYDEIIGDLIIHSSGVGFNQLNDGSGSEPKVIVQLRSVNNAGFFKTITYKIPDPYVAGQERVVIPIAVQGLLEDSRYTISVYGNLDFSDGTPTGTIVNIGTVEVPDTGFNGVISFGSLSSATIPANGFDVVLDELAPGETLPGGGTAGITGVFNALFYLQDELSTEPSPSPISAEYEAARLATIEFELYRGPDTLGQKLGITAKLSSGNADPGKSTLGTDEPSPPGDKRIYNTGNGVTPTYFCVLTEKNFGLTNDDLNGIGTVTIKIKRATDYTSHNTWYGSLNPSFHNEFKLSGDETVTLTVSAVAPPLPNPINDSFVVENITESNRTIHFTQEGTYTGLRPGYSRDTVIGFALTGKFTAPSIAESFTYNLYRSKIANENGLIWQTEDTTNHPNELLQANRDEVKLINHLDTSETLVTDVTVPVIKDTSNQYVNTVPKIIVLFGCKDDYKIVDNPNDATYYYYLNNNATSGQESAGRGYTYYATYKAKLSLTPPSSSPDGNYIYPRDYTGDGLTHLDTTLYSRRLSAPMQQPIIKTYPSYSDIGTETWKYNMRDLDGSYISMSRNVGAHAFDPAAFELVAQPISTSTPAYNSLVVSGIGNGDAFLVRYKYDKWRSTLTGYVAPDDTKYVELMNQYHEEPVSLLPGDYELYVNHTRSRLYLVFRDMTDELHQRTAIAKITIKNVTTGTEKIYQVKIDGNIPFDDDYLPETDRNTDFYSSFIDLQTLTSDLKGLSANPTMSVESIQIFYDSGHRGFDIYANEPKATTTTPTKFFTMQEMKPVGSDEKIGLYFNRIGVSPPYSTLSQMAATLLYYGYKDYVIPANDSASATFNYNVLADSERPVNMSINLSATGALDQVSGLNLVPKLLEEVTSSPISSIGNTFPLPALVPEVYSYSSTSGLVDAEVTFTVRGLSVLEDFGTADDKVKLVLSKRVSAGAGSIDTIIETRYLDVSSDSQTFTLSFTGLDINSLYVFQLSGEVPDGMGYAEKYFFDNETLMTGRYYVFRTIDSVIIGGPDQTNVTLEYHSDTYLSKYIEIGYPINGASIGYYIKFIFENTTTHETKEFTEKKSAYITTGSPNKTTIPIVKDDPFFEFGTEYSVQLVAIMSNGTTEVGSSTVLTYYHPDPSAPDFIVTATPRSTPDGKPADQDPATGQNYPTDFSINPVDSFCSIAGPLPGDGQFIVRVVNSAGEDVTSRVTTGFGAGGLAKNVFTFNKTGNRVRKFSISGQDLPYVVDDTGTPKPYVLKIYAVVDADYDGVADTSGATTLISDLTDKVSSDLSQYWLKDYQFYVHNENEVNIGDIQVVPSVSTTRLIFLNQINLDTAKTLQYTITNIGDDGMVLSSQPITFQLLSSGGASPYDYFDLPTAITTPGRYYIGLNFVLQSDITVSKSFTYTKID